MSRVHDSLLKSPEGSETFPVNQRKIDVEYAQQTVGYVFYPGGFPPGNPRHSSSHADVSETSAHEDMLVKSGDSREQAAKLILRCDFVPVHREELNVTGSDELL